MVVYQIKLMCEIGYRLILTDSRVAVEASGL